eukprot:TRINITY_DN3710_c0_g1_i1.p1 TRINITY_DN3710_c0_g1~~TRINITY_DN3710_c0_g1_i1.p1  ORF type:complete len:336 (+),score=63.11 TRINITY_DN3710_c0_g1_i1:506-1513(+)
MYTVVVVVCVCVRVWMCVYERASVSRYRDVVSVVLSKSKITVEERRMLRGFRRTFGISDQEHIGILKEFDWSEDQYEDGEKPDTSVELDEELAILQSPSGFGIIKLRREDKMNEQKENVFSRVNTRFYETMSKAQANYRIKEVWVIVNRNIKETFEDKKSEFKSQGKDINEIYAFHGSTRESIMAIANTNFFRPDELPQVDDKPTPKVKNKGKGAGKGKSSKAGGSKKTKGKKKNKVEVLDDGFFGKGIYFSLYSDYALWYSEERQSDQILLCKLVRGNSYQCSGRMDGAGQHDGADCHYSPKGNEIILFDPAQVVPRYIITFEVKDAEEREQEG